MERWLWILVAVMTCVAPASGGSVECWNGMEVEWLNSRSWLVRTRAEVRSAGGFRQFLNLRAAADVRWRALPHLTVVTNTQILEGRDRLAGWEESSRFLAGFELPYQGKWTMFTSRTAYEQFFVPGGAGYHRGRQRVAWRLTSVRWQPQASFEYFHDNLGWAAVRPSLSALIPLSERVLLDAGYHYEFRPPHMGGNRHMVYTYLRFRKPR